MIAYSYTCLRDWELVMELHIQFLKANIPHYMFVEEREYDEFMKGFNNSTYVIKRRNGGDNGMGRDGARAKRDVMHQVMKLTTGGTILECDSDVRFLTYCIKYFECEPLQYKAFAGNMSDHYNETFTHKTDVEWPYFTGCIKAYGYELGKKFLSSPTEEYIEHLISHNITPSEDAFLSYGFNKHGKFTNMKQFLKLGVQMKDYRSTSHDIMS